MMAERDGPRYVDETDWSPRTLQVAAALRAYFVRDLARHTADEVLACPGADTQVLAEMNATLAALGLALKATQAGPGAVARRSAAGDLEPDLDWGCLYVRCRDGGDARAVRQAVARAYRKAGLRLVTARTCDEVCRALGIPAEPEARQEGEALREVLMPTLAMNESEVLTEDELIVQDSAEGWVSVMSRRFEWAPPARHPLALELASTLQVLGVTSVSGRYCEITRYESGRARQCHLQGPEPPPVPAGVGALDWAWFDTSAVPADELRQHATDPNAFVTYLGPEDYGYRDLFDRMSLEEVDPATFLVFKARKK